MFTDKDKKVLQVILVLGVVAAVGMFFITRSNKEKITTMTAETKTLNDEITGLEATLKELNLWKERESAITALVQTLSEKTKRLPQKADVYDFYNILRDCVLVTNLSEIRIAQQKIGVVGLVEEIPYRMICRARYHDLGQFLMLVEQHSQQLMRIKTLDVTNDPNRPSRHPVNMQIATFRFVEPAKEVASK